MGSDQVNLDFALPKPYLKEDKLKFSSWCVAFVFGLKLD